MPIKCQDFETLHVINIIYDFLMLVIILKFCM